MMAQDKPFGQSEYAAQGNVPALRRGLALLGVLARHPGPVSAATLAREAGVPRSSTYHLLTELQAAGFVVHLPAERRYALGIAAFELGSSYLRHDPLERLAGPILRRLVDETGHTAHLGVLHGRELVYLIKERPPQPQTVVTDVGVRLPAHLTASGRAMLMHLPKPQVRALFPAASAFVRRTGRGPRSLAELRATLAAHERLGWAVEDGHVTAEFASVAYPAFDHGGRPLAAISLTFRHRCTDENDRSEKAADIECGETWPDLAGRVRRAAGELTTRVGGLPPAT
ncbi:MULTISPECIES: IclR family transcriptional regulator [Prauserella salsuginis group]|uniref:Glycerol operon regulatory protein n=2 Tax=Prauserella salsuginis group TaxID=2893672 RepID=A0A839XEG8_9PSEU|nr:MULTISPECIES: IclR family transcriptional regulator [Prauserella salsuginis group]MBB3661680.1 DNA-binding IclR family transcriptional regulator [Prauserella sediminis]